MIQSAEFQGKDVVTIDKGSSVNVVVLLTPTDLTQEDINELTRVIAIRDGGIYVSKLSITTGTLTNGMLTVGIHNDGLQDGESLNIKLRFRYAESPSRDYVDTSNSIQIIGGATG